MLPRYEPGDLIFVWPEPVEPEETLGLEVAVRTADGRLLLKRLEPGPRRRTFNLASWNAKTITDIEVTWVAKIFMAVRTGQWTERPKAKEASGAVANHNPGQP